MLVMNLKNRPLKYKVRDRFDKVYFKMFKYLCYTLMINTREVANKITGGSIKYIYTYKGFKYTVTIKQERSGDDE